MYYALSDKFTGEYPSENTSGFANTKEVICFRTKKERTEWLKKTRLWTAKALNYNEALKLSSTVEGDRVARLAFEDDIYYVMRASTYSRYSNGSLMK